MSGRSVDIGKLPIRPLPKEMFEIVVCTNCMTRPAKWEFAEGAQAARAFSCSHCFLYEIPQLQEQRIQVDLLVDQVEKKTNLFFKRDEQGRLSEPNDADRIAFGIVMSQRFLQSRTLRGGFG